MKHWFSPWILAALLGPSLARADGSAALGNGAPAGDGAARDLTVSGFVQAQWQGGELSEDELQQGGAALNQTRFVLRRARLRVRREWSSTFTNLEVDLSTLRGTSLLVRRAEAGFFLRSDEAGAPSPLVVTGGITDIPFGYELQWPQDELLFLERTTGSVALFPGIADTGLRVSGALGALRYAVAVQGGQPVDDRSGAGSNDPTSAPDVSGRVGVDVHLTDDVEMFGGFSYLTGTGFSPGSDATKSGVVWRDVNGNGSIDIGELFPVSAAAARPSHTFRRWAAGFDAAARVRSPLGRTGLGGEVTIATNLDRGLFVSDPFSSGRTLRQVAANGWLTHDLEPFFLGIRADLYAPDLDSFTFRRGSAAAVDTTIVTLAPIAGVRFGSGHRLTAQYTVIRDHLGVDTRGVPADLRNDTWAIRVQGAF